MRMPSDGYGLSIHRYPILCCGVHVPVVTIYVVVKAACFIREGNMVSGRMLMRARVVQGARVDPFRCTQEPCRTHAHNEGHKLTDSDCCCITLLTRSTHNVAVSSHEFGLKSLLDY